MKSNKKTLVTGASGHLGANLVHRLLKQGEDVRVLLVSEHNNRALDGLPVEKFYGNLQDKESLTRAVKGCSHIFHAAAKVSTISGNAAHKQEIYNTNVLGTRYLLKSALDEGVQKVVVTGSFSAVGYDANNPSLPACEEKSFYPFRRMMPYEITKALMELEVMKKVTEGLDVSIAISCAIVGGHDYLPSRLGRTLCDYVHGKLRFYINGGFEFVTAEDIVSGHLLAMEKGVAGQRYIFSSEYKTIKEIVSIFSEVSGQSKLPLRLPSGIMLPLSEVISSYLSRFHPSFNQRFTPGAIRLLQKCRRADTTKAKDFLGYKPGLIKDAVHEAYEFHKSIGGIKK